MTPPRPPRRFRERTVRSGWCGAYSASQPAVDDRLLTLRGDDLAIACTPAERIARIDQDGPATVYHLANGTIITAPTGARITWEEQ